MSNRLPAAASPRADDVLAVMEQRSREMFTTEIAEILGRHPSGIRTHLYSLERAGRVRRRRAQNGDRGRPRDAWFLAGSDEPNAPDGRAPSSTDYADVAELRSSLRAYLAWAEDAARRHETTPMQFQLALAIRANALPDGPSVGDLADALQLKHHSAVGLIDRAERSGLVRRERDPVNGSRVRVALTSLGEDRLAALAGEHLAHLRSVAPSMAQIWSAFLASAERGIERAAEHD